MTSSRVLDLINPLQRHLTDEERALRTLRASCALVSLLPVPFGWLFHLSETPVHDPMWARWTLTIFSLALFGATFWSRYVSRHARLVNQLATYAIGFYFGVVTWANDFSDAYGVGYLFVFVVTGLAQSLNYQRLLPYARYLLGSTLLSIAWVIASDAPLDTQAIFVLATVSTAAVLLLTVQVRFLTLGELDESEAHLAEAQAAAGMGSWELMVRTGDVRWSQGMYRLLGLDAYAVPPSIEAFLDHVHPDDRSGLTVMDAGTDALTIRYRRQGEVAWRRAQVRRTLVVTPLGISHRAFGTIQDTTEAHDRETALRDALVVAEDATRAKSGFLANMSHEIRTPLTAILGFAQLLAEETDAAHHDLVDPIVKGGERLLTTLNSVLDLARMEAGEADLALAPVDVAAEVTAVAGLLAAQAAAKGIGLRAEAPETPLRVLGDAAALSRVLTNLASNAVKFTGRGEVVLRVAPSASGREAVLTVRDTGRGMDAAFLNELFEPFRQASTGWARSHEGTGLGLTIVKRLVEGMGGTVSVESTPKVGTCFTVRLRLAPEAAPAAAAEATRPAPVAA